MLRVRHVSQPKPQPEPQPEPACFEIEKSRSRFSLLPSPFSVLTTSTHAQLLSAACKVLDGLHVWLLNTHILGLSSTTRDSRSPACRADATLSSSLFRQRHPISAIYYVYAHQRRATGSGLNAQQSYGCNLQGMVKSATARRRG